MTAGPHPFPAPGFFEPAAELAASLAPLGIALCGCRAHRPCADEQQRDGRWARRIGGVVAHPDGRIVAHPRSDACNRARIILLRCAEEALVNGTRLPGWFERPAAGGGDVERYCTVIAYLDDGPPAAAESLATAHLWTQLPPLAQLDPQLAVAHVSSPAA